MQDLPEMWWILGWPEFNTPVNLFFINRSRHKKKNIFEDSQQDPCVSDLLCNCTLFLGFFEGMWKDELCDFDTAYLVIQVPNIIFCATEKKEHYILLQRCEDE